MKFSLILVLVFLAVRDTAFAQASVVPPGHDTSEGNWLSGRPFTGHSGRHQLIIERRHLTALGTPWQVGQLWLRRDMTQADAMRGGTIDLEVWGGNTTTSADRAVDVFQGNRANTVDFALRFRGSVTLPDVGPAPSTPAPWAAPYAISIPFTVPIFDYGGNLLLEMVVQDSASSPSPGWWVVDSVLYPSDQSEQIVGQSCSTHPVKATASVGSGSLRVGSTSTFSLSGGPAGTSALHFLGFSDTHLFGQPILPLPLAFAGAPGCMLYNDITWISAHTTQAPPRASYGVATARLTWPVDPALVSLVGFTQWLVIEPGANSAGWVTTNSVRFQLASSPSTTGLAIIFAAAAAQATGAVTRHVFPVLRLVP